MSSSQKQYYVEMFKSYPIITKTPIRLCVEEVQIDDKYINYDGSFEEFEHGEYEMCTIKPGTPLWVSWMPNKGTHITQSEGGVMSIETRFKLGQDFDFDYSKPHLLPKEYTPSKHSGPKPSNRSKPKGPKI